MRGYYNDWNTKNHDYGFDPIIWGNCPPPKSVEIIKSFALAGINITMNTFNGK